MFRIGRGIRREMLGLGIIRIPKAKIKKNLSSKSISITKTNINYNIKINKEYNLTHHTYKKYIHSLKHPHISIFLINTYNGHSKTSKNKALTKPNC